MDMELVDGNKLIDAGRHEGVHYVLIILVPYGLFLLYVRFRIFKKTSNGKRMDSRSDESKCSEHSTLLVH